MLHFFQTSMTTLLLFYVVPLLVLSGLTSMTEAALFSVPVSQVHLAVDRKHRLAEHLLRIKEDLRRPIATIVILNNTVNIVGSIYIGSQAAKLFKSEGVGIFSACLTFLVIVFAEIAPKTIGEKYCGTVSLYAAPVVQLMTQILLPLIWVIEKIVRPLTGKEEPKVSSEDEINVLAQLANRSGEITQEESDLVQKVFRLNDITAKDIMTHRVEISSFPADMKLREIDRDELQTEHSRILVVEEGDLDRIVGIAYLRDILLTLAAGNGDKTIGEIAKEAKIIYEGTVALTLLEEFQKTRQHLFVVLDEYGGTSGVVSLEDVLEELVGEIRDETDEVEPLDPGRQPVAPGAVGANFDA